MKRKATTSSAQSDIQLHIHNWNSCESYVDTDKSQSHSILFFLQHYCFQSKRSFWFIFFVIFFLVICFILVLTLFKEQASLCSYVESFVAEQNTENNCFHNGILIFNPVTVTETKLLKCFQSLKNHFAQFLETTPNLADTALDSIRHSLFYETFWDLGSYIYVKDIFIRSLCSKVFFFFFFFWLIYFILFYLFYFIFFNLIDLLHYYYYYYYYYCFNYRIHIILQKKLTS